MKLPSIVITGTQQQLIEIEPLLVLIGYDKSDEKWNNHRVSLNEPFETLLANEHREIMYHNHFCRLYNPEIFKSTDTKGIINYIEKYNKG